MAAQTTNRGRRRFIVFSFSARLPQENADRRYLVPKKTMACTGRGSRKSALDTRRRWFTRHRVRWAVFGVYSMTGLAAAAWSPAGFGRRAFFGGEMERIQKHKLERNREATRDRG
jgi:hypothetical protein